MRLKTDKFRLERSYTMEAVGVINHRSNALRISSSLEVLQGRSSVFFLKRLVVVQTGINPGQSDGLCLARGQAG